MNKIKILSEEVANRIAAGEVIERPVSVVKELVENSIDSGADEIGVILENGGKKLIKVIDNGCGMSEDDALTSFERHATSKIRTTNDIFNISSLGFRGEALPSIASVSRLKMITKTEDDEIATQIDFNSGRLVNVTKTSSQSGTTITVNKLFGNVPARKKFLKTTQVEYKHILNYIYYQSLIFPEIHFKLVSNEAEKINFPKAENRRKRLLAVFGSDFLKQDFIEIECEKAGMKISGYIGGLEEEKSILNIHYLFVNDRFIKDKIVLHSIRSAYEPFLKKLRVFQQNKTPSYILYLNLNPSQVDFNVHPAKLELRFNDPGTIHGFIKNTLSQALMNYENKKYENIRTKISSKIKSGKTSDLEKKIFRKKTDKKRFKEIRKELDDIYQPDLFKKKEYLNDDLNLRKHDILLRREEEVINPWQLHLKYIFIQVEDGLVIIDQHAAHERIIYEKILQRIHGSPAQTQKLLFPIVIEIPPIISNDFSDLLEKNIEIFEKSGFHLKTFSGKSIVIDEIPVELQDWDGGKIFIEILQQLEEEFSETQDIRDSLSKSVACKAAIKTGKKLSKKEMLALINDLFACEVPYYCPHGRPLLIKTALTDFDKKFKRNV